jgi:hypothetical protein
MGTMSRSSATPARGAAFFTYKGKPVDLRQIGRKLNVRYVLEGSVQRASQSATQAAKASCDPNYNASDAPRGDPQQSERDQHEAPTLQAQISGRLGSTPSPTNFKTSPAPPGVPRMLMN